MTSIYCIPRDRISNDHKSEELHFIYYFGPEWYSSYGTRVQTIKTSGRLFHFRTCSLPVSGPFIPRKISFQSPDIIEFKID